MFALLENLGSWELVLVGLVALLIYGKDLPRVAGQAGQQLTKLRRSLEGTWRDTGLERELRQIRDAIPRDLSVSDVARAAGEKLAVRLEEEHLPTAQADPQAVGTVARGAVGPDPPVGPASTTVPAAAVVPKDDEPAARR